MIVPGFLLRPTMFRDIDRVLLRVSSLPAAVRFYGEVLGMQVVGRQLHSAILKFPAGPSELVLHDDPDLPAEAVYYRVEDVQELYRRRDTLGLVFASAPVRVSRGFKAALKDPFGNVLQIIDRKGAAANEPLEDARASEALFQGVRLSVPIRRQLLVDLYLRVGRTADDLPYTPHFEQIYGPYATACNEPRPDRAEVWRHLLNLRKGGKLPRLGEARSHPPEISDGARTQLKTLLAHDLGKRDRLPYTARFDALVDAFNRTLPRPLSPHLVWRLVATLAK